MYMYISIDCETRLVSYLDIYHRHYMRGVYYKPHFITFCRAQHTIRRRGYSLFMCSAPELSSYYGWQSGVRAQGTIYTKYIYKNVGKCVYIHSTPLDN